MFRFATYELVGEGAVTASDNSDFSADVAAQGSHYEISGELSGLSAGPAATVPITISLRQVTADIANVPNAGGLRLGSIFRTSVTIPLGETVVLGSAAPRQGSTEALILTVRPERMKP